jgi:hypothetical protein
MSGFRHAKFAMSDAKESFYQSSFRLTLQIASLKMPPAIQSEIYTIISLVPLRSNCFQLAPANHFLRFSLSDLLVRTRISGPISSRPSENKL